MAPDPKWEQLHSERDWGRYPPIELVRWAKRSDIPPQALILDLGSGQGAASWFLNREGFKAIQVDGSLSALRKAKAYLNVDTGVRACLTHLPLVSQAFDAAVDVVSLAHNDIASIGMILREVVRVLKPGGKFFTMLPTNRCSRWPFRGLRASFFEKEDVEDLLSTGFREVQVLSSSYQLEPSITVSHWVAQATRR